MSVSAGLDYGDTYTMSDGTTKVQEYVNAADWSYPSKENISMFGPVLLPKIYGSNLSELEVASDGQIVLTVNNTRSLFISEANDILEIKGEGKEINLTSTLSVINLGGATTIEKTLSVVGATELDSTLNVNKATTLGSTLSVADNTFMDGTLSVTGATELDSTLNVDKATTLGSTLSVTGATELASNVNVIGPKFTIPRGDEANRPSDTVAANKGSLYYNEELDRFEGLFKTGTNQYTWNTLGGVIDSDQDTHILAEKNNGDDDKLFFTAKGSEVMTLDNKKLTFNATDASGSNVEINADVVDVNAELQVSDSLLAQSNLIVTKETKLNSTLSVTGISTFASDIRMNENAGLLRPPQYTTKSGYSNTTNIVADNEGSIVYDTNQGVFMGLSQPPGVGAVLDWRPIGGGSISDADGDTSIKAETTFGSDEDRLTFTTSGDLIATMSNDKVEIRKNLSVSNPVNIQDTLTVASNIETTNSGTLTVSGVTRLTNKLSVGGATTLANSLSVFGTSRFDSDVTVKPGQKILSETTLTNRLGHYTHFNENGESTSLGSLDMFYENVMIHGNLDIRGSINQSATEVQELFVEDKAIVLGTKSENIVRSNAQGEFEFVHSNYTVQETDMNKSGIRVSGLPDYIPANDEALYSNDLRFEKSILWTLPSQDTNGTSNLAITSRDDSIKHNEPFWDIKGGHLRLTTNTSATDQSKFISFAFRINSKEQLELVKISNSASGAGDFKTIAKFGSVASV